MANVEMLPTEHPGEFIVEEIEARNWAQADLAFVLGWDTAQLSRLIKGRTSVTTDSALILADAFDMPPDGQKAAPRILPRPGIEMEPVMCRRLVHRAASAS